MKLQSYVSQLFFDTKPFLLLELAVSQMHCVLFVPVLAEVIQ